MVYSSNNGGDDNDSVKQRTTGKWATEIRHSMRAGHTAVSRSGATITRRNEEKKY